MVIVSGLIGVLALGIGATLFMALLRWLVLIGIAILCGIGIVSVTIGAIVFFGLYQFYGPEYGSLVVAISIAVGLMLAMLLFLGIATELGVRQGKPAKETYPAC